MSGRIPLLDADERAAICSVLDGELPGAWSSAHIDMIIEAINGVRCGEPVGTIKRSNGGVLALLTDLEKQPWVGVDSRGYQLGHYTHREMSHWPVIYRPEVER